MPTQTTNPGAIPGFDAVAESRKWRIETGRKLNAMPLAERLAYLARERERYLEKQPILAASFATSAAHEEPAAPKPAKAFDAVAESRKWKEAVARETKGMSRAEVLEFFNSARTASSHPRENEETCVVREEPPKA